MKYYVGIDLGTTNSSICSFDGKSVTTWKSLEQNDITPSAIYIDKRGNRFYGLKAYNQAQYNPNNSATLFKRFLGTKNIMTFESSGVTLTPEECSAEIIKVLYGYLPEEIRNDSSVATVITVPAAFNQMKKDATLQAANLAGLVNVALIQEPVAAVMSVMRHSSTEGIFLIYDLGGGTFDISIAENIGGKVSLLAHNGIEMCGGRDFDRFIFTKTIIPWLVRNFRLPDKFYTDAQYSTLCRLAQWAAERAKIELSARPESNITLSESEARCMDLDGNEIYINIPISRSVFDGYIDEMIMETIDVTKESIMKAGITSDGIEKIVFVGGPTNYKPLRDKVAFELAIKVSNDVNSMTAVAEGASIFAESIDWTTSSHNRKPINEMIDGSNDVSVRYTSRTTNSMARIMLIAKINNDLSVQVTSMDTGWTSGRASFMNEFSLEVPLVLDGENVFEVVVYDQYGREIKLKDKRIIITKTLASISAIPATHAIGVEVMEKLGGKATLDYLVLEGDTLPKKGKKIFKSGQALKAGSLSSINIKLWEGTILFPIDDNRFIGMLKILGSDFSEGVVPMGADIECYYEMSDSGAINLEVSIPCIGATFNNRNFYSRQEGLVDLDDIEKIKHDGKTLLERIESISAKVDDGRLDKASKKATNATTIDNYSYEPEDVQRASNELLESKRLVAQIRKEHLPEIRQMDLDGLSTLYRDAIQPLANQAEKEVIANLLRTLQRSIDIKNNDFENQLNELAGKLFVILWRQDWFVIERFNNKIADPHNFINKVQYEQLKQKGQLCIRNDDIDELREVIAALNQIQISETSAEEMLDLANIIKG